MERVRVIRSFSEVVDGQEVRHKTGTDLTVTNDRAEYLKGKRYVRKLPDQSPKAEAEKAAPAPVEPKGDSE